MNGFGFEKFGGLISQVGLKNVPKLCRKTHKQYHMSWMQT
jgi:hypothetical protein